MQGQSCRVKTVLELYDARTKTILQFKDSPVNSLGRSPNSYPATGWHPDLAPGRRSSCRIIRGQWPCRPASTIKTATLQHLQGLHILQTASELKYDLKFEICTNPCVYCLNGMGLFGSLQSHYILQTASKAKVTSDLRIVISDLNYIYCHVYLASKCHFINQTRRSRPRTVSQSAVWPNLILWVFLLVILPGELLYFLRANLSDGQHCPSMWCQDLAPGSCFIKLFH